jgi:anti-anti-sigma regulatory factor
VLGRHEPPLSVECRWEDRRATVVVRGEVDFATVGILARWRPSNPSTSPSTWAGTSFLDAAGLRVIARAHRALTPRCPLTLRSPTRHVRLVLEVSGLAGECPIEDPPS